MSREQLIQKALIAIQKLPQEKIMEVSDFADFILKKHEDELLAKGISKIVAQGKPYTFLENDDNIYTVNDLKEKYK